jgi:hypothetical protein
MAAYLAIAAGLSNGRALPARALTTIFGPMEEIETLREAVRGAR